MALTDIELQSIVTKVLSAIRTNAKTIDELTPVTELTDDNCFEVDGGKKISYASFKSIFSRICEDSQTSIQAQILKNEKEFREGFQTLSNKLNTAIFTLPESPVGSIEISEIDLMGCESMAGLKDMVANGKPAIYNIWNGGKNCGLLIMFSAGDCAVTQVLMSNYSGEGNSLFNAHVDDTLKIHYRYCPLNAAGVANTGVDRYTWSAWKEWMSGSVDDLKREITGVKAEVAELRRLLSESDANFGTMEIEWLESESVEAWMEARLDECVWSKVLPSRIEGEMWFRVGVSVNAAHVTDGVKDWNVKRLSGDAAADSQWNGRHPLASNPDGYVYIRITTEDILDATGTTFVFTASYSRVKNGISYSQTVEGRLSLEMGGLIFYIDRGIWTAGEKYYCNTLNAEGRHETSDVWRYGNKWRCQTTHNSTSENGPGFAIPFWEFIEGDDRFTVEFEEPYSVVDINNIEVPLTVRGWYHGEDVTAFISDSDVVWSRYSETAENEPRVEQDAEWNAQNGGRGKSVLLTESDFESRGSEGLGRISFTAVVTLRHPRTGAKLTATKAYTA